jgi:thymidylate synthase
MNNYEKSYSNILIDCLNSKELILGRNGYTKQITATQIRANLNDGFPIVTGKKIFPKSCFIETEWMLHGHTNVKWLNERNVNIWDQWADENGDLGPVYGHQLVNFNGINQIENIVKETQSNKHSRRLLCSMWNPNDLQKMLLPPCHYSFQFVISNNKVDIVVSMRSLDLFIGLPYDMVMYSSILSSFANEFKLQANEVIINAANSHIYQEHFNAVKLYLNQEKYELPKLLQASKFSNFLSIEMVISKYQSNNRIIVPVIK